MSAADADIWANLRSSENRLMKGDILLKIKDSSNIKHQWISLAQKMGKPEGRSSEIPSYDIVHAAIVGAVNDPGTVTLIQASMGGVAGEIVINPGIAQPTQIIEFSDAFTTDSQLASVKDLWVVYRLSTPFDNIYPLFGAEGGQLENERHIIVGKPAFESFPLYQEMNQASSGEVNAAVYNFELRTLAADVAATIFSGGATFSSKDAVGEYQLAAAIKTGISASKITGMTEAQKVQLQSLCSDFTLQQNFFCSSFVIYVYAVASVIINHTYDAGQQPVYPLDINLHATPEQLFLYFQNLPVDSPWKKIKIDAVPPQPPTFIRSPETLGITPREYFKLHYLLMSPEEKEDEQFESLFLKWESEQLAAKESSTSGTGILHGFKVYSASSSADQSGSDSSVKPARRTFCATQ